MPSEEGSSHIDPYTKCYKVMARERIGTLHTLQPSLRLYPPETSVPFVVQRMLHNV